MNAIKKVLSSDSSSSHHNSTTTGSDPRLGSSGTSGATSSSGPGGPGGREQLPVERGVHGRAEETGPGSKVQGSTPGFKDPHSLGHDRSNDLANNFSLKDAVHDHVHLGHKTHEHHHHHETEEVRREKEHERHVHHVQHHVQPVHDRKDIEEHETRHVPQTKIKEHHGSTKEDIAAFTNLGRMHKDEVHHSDGERRVVDLGETVNEHVHHHVHNVVQPILNEDHHHHKTIHTTIPSHHVSHEAPIVHESLSHKPVSKEAFLGQGGKLGSSTTHNEAGILQEGGCDREVDGVGESLAQKLGLKSGTAAHETRGDTRI